MLYCPAVNFKRTLPFCLAGLLLACTGCMMPNREAQTAHNETRIAAEGIVKLDAGATAPALSAPSTAGQVELPALLADGKRVVLFIFPVIDTPNSTRELQQFGKDLAEYTGQGILVYGMTGATLDELTAYKSRYQLSVELIADPGLVLAQAYGCALPGGTYPQRTTIGINPDGKIAFYKRHQMLKAEILEGFGLKKK
jgi:thioredoxin-dependent peroxiredoxin